MFQHIYNQQEAERGPDQVCEIISVKLAYNDLSYYEQMN